MIARLSLVFTYVVIVATATIAEEHANVVATESPTPAEFQQPPEPSVDEEMPRLIVARKVLIFEGRAMGWPELAEVLERRAASKGGDIETLYYSCTRAASVDAFRTQEAQNWSKLLSESTGINIRQRGMVYREAAERYDTLKVGDSWPPGAEHPVNGRVVDADGTPVENALVVLLLPSARYRSATQSIALLNGKVGQLEDQIATHTDESGQFQFEFPITGANVVATSPKGFALVAASSERSDIVLERWSRVTAEVEQDENLGEYTVTLNVYITPPERERETHVSISMGMPGKAGQSFDVVAVPAAQKVRARRMLWKQDDNGFLTGNPYGPAYEFATKPGTTHHLEFGPVEENR